MRCNWIIYDARVCFLWCGGKFLLWWWALYTGNTHIRRYHSWKTSSLVSRSLVPSGLGLCSIHKDGHESVDSLVCHLPLTGGVSCPAGFVFHIPRRRLLIIDSADDGYASHNFSSTLPSASIDVRAEVWKPINQLHGIWFPVTRICPDIGNGFIVVWIFVFAQMISRPNLCVSWSIVFNTEDQSFKHLGKDSHVVGIIQVSEPLWSVHLVAA